MSNNTEKPKIAKKGRSTKAGSSNGVSKALNRGWKKKDPNGSEDEIGEDEQCIICAERMVIGAISPCNHITCHKCTFRQRALFEKKACLVCRTENDKVVFTEDFTSEITDFDASNYTKFDEKYGINFDNLSIYEETFKLLNFNCPVCPESFPNFKKLSEHVKSDHDRFYCLICATNKKAFCSELKIYTHRQLQRHQQQGDEDGFEGHPTCQYCSGKRFYSEDELNVHIRHNHERCHICDQTIRSNPSYYRDYDSLYDHYRMEHYVCTVSSCVEQKFVVFRDEIDLTAHMLKEHGNIYNGSNKFIIGANYGGFNNSTSSSRQRFRSQLTTFQSPVAASSSTSHNTSNNKNGARSNDDEVDSFDIKQKRLEERARHYLNYNNKEINEFLTVNKSYRSGNITANDVLESYENLFKGKENVDMNILIYELSELFNQNSDQHKSLLKILDRLKVKDGSYIEQFPVLGLNNTGSGTNSSTWGNSKAQEKKKNSEKFPALPKPKKQGTPVVSNAPIRYQTVLKKGNSVQKIKINVASESTSYKPTYLSNTKPSNSSSSSSSSSAPTVSPLSSRSKGKTVSDSNFPALPKIEKKPPPPRVNQISINSSTWRPGRSASEEASATDPVFGNLRPVEVGQGKKKNKKQVLQFHIGI